MKDCGFCSKSFRPQLRWSKQNFHFKMNYLTFQNGHLTAHNTNCTFTTIDITGNNTAPLVISPIVGFGNVGTNTKQNRHIC